MQVWDLLVWSDGQSRSPVAVVAKMHYFARLDVTQTVRNFAAECPRFWSSEEFRDTLEGSSILALDSAFFVQVLCLALPPSSLDGTLIYRLPWDSSDRGSKFMDFTTWSQLVVLRWDKMMQCRQLAHVVQC